MTSTERMNPAPAVYAAAVAAVVFIISFFAGNAIGGGVQGGEWAFPVTIILILVMGMSATIAVAMATEGVGPMAFFTAICIIVVALNVALFLCVGFIIEDSGLPIPAIVLPVFVVLAIIIAGLANFGAVAACRRWFPDARAIRVVVVAIFANVFVVGAISAASASQPDAGDLFSGMGGDIWIGTGLASIFAGEIWFVVTVVFLVAAALRNRCRNAGIDRIIFTVAVGGAVVLAIITIAFTVSITGISIANSDRSFDIPAAIVAGVVSLLSGLAVTGAAALIGTACRRYYRRALREKRS